MCRLDQAEGFIEAMQALLQRLQIEAQRAAATPAERLLDDALQILAGSAQMEYQARKQVSSPRSVPFISPRLNGGGSRIERQLTEGRKTNQCFSSVDEELRRPSPWSN